ncbi:MAG: cytidylate kinase [Blastopirellula sp.]|nr:cytidylate kinase [Blastopirellula sp.]
MIVTIDGPAGAGKSSAARGVAHRLGFRFLDTGAMYRAVACAALQRGVDLNDGNALAALTAELEIEVTEDQVLLDGQDVSRAIRTSEVTAAVKHVADNPNIRSHLVRLQQRTAHDHHTVTEGRDQGTVAFPNAECKIFLTATPQERARRRQADLEARGETVSVDEVLQQQNLRDQQDAEREVGRMAKAEDAVEVITDGMTASGVIDALEAIVRSKM